MNILLNNLQALSTGRLAVLGGVAGAVAIALWFLISQMAAPPLVSLYAGLEPEAAASVLQRLDQLGVTYRVQGDSVVLVPADQAAQLRMTLAGEGLPNGAPVGYELFDQGQGLGFTRTQEDVRYVRALEGELARSIKTLNDVANARVHLVLAKREPFARETPAPTASVLLVMRGAASLSKSQVQAIQFLVSRAVPQLKPQSVSVVDHYGNLLAGAIEEDGANAAASNDARAAFESRLARSIEGLLEPHLGPGKVRVSVTADLDFDRIVERQELFDPNGQVVRSTQTLSETEASSDGAAGDVVGVSKNLPQAGNTNPSAGPGGSDSSSRKEETVNYEISSRTLETIQESGAVRKLSVAVLVDGVTVADANGEPSYQARTPEELAEIDRVVKAAIGFDGERGDKVEVANLPFSGSAIVEQEIDDGGIMEFLARNAMTFVQWFALSGVVIVLALFVLRPLVNNLFKPVALLPQPTSPSSTTPDALSQGNRNVLGMSTGSTSRGAVIVNAPPEDAAGVIRGWIAEGTT